MLYSCLQTGSENERFLMNVPVLMALHALTIRILANQTPKIVGFGIHANNGGQCRKLIGREINRLRFTQAY